jgi:hypothetical protein
MEGAPGDTRILQAPLWPFEVPSPSWRWLVRGPLSLRERVRVRVRFLMRLSWCLLLAIGLVAGLGAVSGCRREIPENELGRVLDHVPQLPGMDKPYDKLRYVAPRSEASRMGPGQIPPKETTDASKGPEPAKDATAKKAAEK